MAFVLGYNDDRFPNNTPITCAWGDSVPDGIARQGIHPSLPKLGMQRRKSISLMARRYSDGTGQGPDSDISYNSVNGGAFSDQGISTHTPNHGVGHPPTGNGGTGRDCRVFAYRHGYQKQRGPADAYKGNFGFFDGHVELLGDLESTRPEYWLPKGSRLWPSINGGGDSPSGELNKDTANLYFPGASAGTPIIIP